MRRPTLGRSVLCMLALFYGVHCDNGIGSEDFVCEVAVAHLSECCPDLSRGSLDCTTIAAGGCNYSSLPVFDHNESDCIIALSCDEVRANGLCERVATLPAATQRCYSPTDCFDGGVYRDPVCP